MKPLTRRCPECGTDQIVLATGRLIDHQWPSEEVRISSIMVDPASFRTVIAPGRQCTQAERQ